MADPCPTGRCVDHENRIKNLEGDMKDVQQALKNPAVAVALISLGGMIFSGLCGVAGVILAPIVRSWMGIGP